MLISCTDTHIWHRNTLSIESGVAIDQSVGRSGSTFVSCVVCFNAFNFCNVCSLSLSQLYIGSWDHLGQQGQVIEGSSKVVSKNVDGIYRINPAIPVMIVRQDPSSQHQSEIDVQAPGEQCRLDAWPIYSLILTDTFASTLNRCELALDRKIHSWLAGHLTSDIDLRWYSGTIVNDPQCVDATKFSLRSKTRHAYIPLSVHVWHYKPGHHLLLYIFKYNHYISVTS